MNCGAYGGCSCAEGPMGRLLKTAREKCLWLAEDRDEKRGEQM